MSGIGGWFESGAGAVGEERSAQVAAALARFDRPQLITRTAPFGAVALATLPSDFSDFHADDDRIVAIWGRADLSGSESGRVEIAGAAAALAAGYEREGHAILRRLSGAFAIAILDGRRGKAVLAVDRSGSRPVFYCLAGGRLAFGSSLDAVRSALPRPPAVSPQAVYDYVYHHMVPAPDSIYQDVQRLLPGECLIFDGSTAVVERYWQMRFVEDASVPFADLSAEFRRLLRASVARASARGNVGAFLSGGTDSSTIAGLLGDVTGMPARTYSIGFDAPGFDEMSYARIAAAHFKTRHHEYYVTADDIVTAVPRIAAVHDQPFGNSSAIPAYFCAKLAQEDGVDTMLGGDGGDELFGGNERYAKQYLYSLYGDLPAGLRGVLEPLAFLLPEIGLVGKAQRYMRNASQPMPGRYENYNLLERLGPSRVFTPDFLASVEQDAPRTRMAAIYADTNAHSLINRMLALDVKYTLADNDLPKVSKSCELAGVGVRYPMLDDDVVAFSATLPPRLKLDRTRLRVFFKDALRGYLPDAIIRKTKHGFGLPFGLWVRTHDGLRALAFDSLSGLKQRGIVKREFIDALVSKHLADHATYYGTMVWVLMMLEQWYVGHGSAPAVPDSVRGNSVDALHPVEHRATDERTATVGPID